MSSLAGWTLGGVFASQVAYLVTANVASSAGESLNQLGIDGPSLNSLSIAYLLTLLPHGIVTVSLTTALYTHMSGAAARNNFAEVESLSNLALRPVAYVSLAAAAVFVAVGPILTEAIFGTPLIGHVLQVLAVGLVGFSQAYVLNRTSFTLQDARGPFITQLTIAVLSAAGALAAAILLPPQLTVIGIAAGISIANIAGWSTAHVLLRRTFRKRGHEPDSEPAAVWGLTRLLATAMISAAAGLATTTIIGTPASFIGRALIFLLAALIVSGVFVGISWLLGDRTIKDLRR